MSGIEHRYIERHEDADTGEVLSERLLGVLDEEMFAAAERVRNLYDPSVWIRELERIGVPTVVAEILEREWTRQGGLASEMTSAGVVA